MRIGTILSADSVLKSDLLKMEVSFGELGTRTILSGIATSFTPEAQGMLFAAERSDGIVALIQPSAVVPDGAAL